MSAEAIKAKSALVEEIAAKLKGAQSAVVVEYRGLSVAEMTELRNNLRAEDVELKVYKNSLVQRATVATEYEGLNAELGGVTMSAEAIKAKSALVEEIAAKLKGAQSAVVVEYRGLSVAEMTELRNNLRAEDVELKVYKNSLVQRATVATEYEGLNAELTGPNAIALGNSDAVAPARVIAKFAKDHEALVIKAAVVEGKLLTVDEVKEISKLPNREGMYSMLLGMLQAPVSKFARVVKAVAEAKPEDGSAAEEAAPVEEAAPETPVVEETAEETKEEIAE